MGSQLQHSELLVNMLAEQIVSRSEPLRLNFSPILLEPGSNSEEEGSAPKRQKTKQFNPNSASSVNRKPQKTPKKKPMKKAAKKSVASNKHESDEDVETVQKMKWTGELMKLYLTERFRNHMVSSKFAAASNTADVTLAWDFLAVQFNSKAMSTSRKLFWDESVHPFELAVSQLKVTPTLTIFHILY